MEKAEDSLREGLAATLRELADGGVDDAERMSAELLDVRPEDPAAHLLAATIALRRARYSDAERWPRSCLALHPLHAPAMLVAGRAARALGDIVQARDWFRRASEAAPDRAEPAFLLCVAQLECADPAAQESLARIMRKFPRDSQGWSQIGAALRKANQLEAAALAFARAFAASGDAAHAVDQGSVLMKLGRIEEAVAAFRAASVVAPDSVDVALPLARALRQLGEFRAALALLERIAALAPESDQIHFALGLLHDDLNDGSEATAAYRRCVALRPDLPEAQVNLGVALQQAGEFEAATDCYRAAMRARPDTFGRIAQALPSTSKGQLWLDLGKLRRSLGGQRARRTRYSLR
jgi:tetratricopeptide (TPR) repeat protein